MANFLTSLWEAVFTPGPTPTLLLATNATFALLQLTLAALLFATLSIHFLILSMLCGGLWAAINWFAAELHAAGQKEEEAERIRKRQAEARGGLDVQVDGEGKIVVVGGDDDGEKGNVSGGGGVLDDEVREKVLQDLRKSGEASMAHSSSGLQHAEGGEAKQRRTAGQNGDMSASGEISTDSEWEQVEQDER